MDDTTFRENFDGTILMKELLDAVKAQTPVGMHEEAGIVMSVSETCDIIQVWMMKNFAFLAEHQVSDGQKLFALGNIVGCGTLQIKAIKDAMV